jgi:hypothetical protein
LSKQASFFKDPDFSSCLERKDIVKSGGMRGELGRLQKIAKMRNSKKLEQYTAQKLGFSHRV